MLYCNCQSTYNMLRSLCSFAHLHVQSNGPTKSLRQEMLLIGSLIWLYCFSKDRQESFAKQEGSQASQTIGS